MTEADKNHKNTVNILRWKGLAFAESGHLDEAIRYFLDALLHSKADANLHNNLANAYNYKHAFDLAINHYEQAVLINPNYAQAHNNLASLLTRLGDYPRALQHYKQALHAAPDFALAHYNLGLLLLKKQDRFAAKTQFNNVVTLNPDHVQAHFYLGVLALDEGALDEAEQAFQRVLTQNNEHTDALINLGVIALKRQHDQQAITYFTQALAYDQTHIDARNNLAATFMHHDRFENALTHYAPLLEHDPNNPEYLYNAGVAEMALGHLQTAKTHFETLLIHQPQHFAALTNLAAIHVRLNEHPHAIRLLTQAHHANPNDASCQFMLNALTKRTDVHEACPDYTRNLFDNYAIYYDQHMQQTLHYSIPQHIGRALHQQHDKHMPMARTLDLGCGTGLSGIVLRELSVHLTGIDLSTKMLRHAKEKALYDLLLEAELLTFLQQDTQTYDLVVAADVLPYFGELNTLFQAVRQRLINHGLFIFTIEIGEHADWQLQESARFNHHPDYILTLAKQHQLTIKHQERIIARLQKDQDLRVLLYVIQAE